MLNELKKKIKEANTADFMGVGYFNEDTNAKTCESL